MGNLHRIESSGGFLMAKKKKDILPERKILFSFSITETVFSCLLELAEQNKMDIETSINQILEEYLYAERI